MPATNRQVQTWANERTRPRAEQFRALAIQCESDNAQIGDVYANLTTLPTWTDDRNDHPPSLLTPADLLAINTLSVMFRKFVEGTFSSVEEANSAAAQWPIVEKACVRPPL